MNEEQTGISMEQWILFDMMMDEVDGKPGDSEKSILDYFQTLGIWEFKKALYIPSGFHATADQMSMFRFLEKHLNYTFRLLQLNP